MPCDGERVRRGPLGGGLVDADLGFYDCEEEGGLPGGAALDADVLEVEEAIRGGADGDAEGGAGPAGCGESVVSLFSVGLRRDDS